MVDRDRVDQLFAMLTRYVRILRDLADIPLAEYQADPRNFGSGERFLQLAIETALSVGHHIIASAGFDQPTTYAEVFRVHPPQRLRPAYSTASPRVVPWTLAGWPTFTFSPR
jgi:uncharacterized protein YutE (UPF0331/DUF86 family)